MSPDKILEIIAAVSGIVSVWFSRKGNILVYPVGLINTAFYTYLSFKYQLIGESSVNFYYTIMSIYGWILWSEKDKTRRPVLHISYSDNKLLKTQVVFFLLADGASASHRPSRLFAVVFRCLADALPVKPAMIGKFLVFGGHYCQLHM